MNQLLVYTSFPILGYTAIPSWVNQLQTLFQAEDDVIIYNPRWSMEENNKASHGRFYNLLDRPIQITDETKAMWSHLQLDESLAAPLSSLPSDVFEDNGLAANLVFRDLFVLLRSYMLVADANNPSFGGVGQEVLYAHLLRKYVLLVSDRYMPGPWLTAHSNATVSSSCVSQQVAFQLMAYQKALENMAEQAKKAEEEETTNQDAHSQK